MKISILGARGSVPTNGKDMLEFGGSTSCVLVETEDQAIFLDAGTGILHSPDVGKKPISILITHPHFDHIMGLPFFPYNGEKGRKINIYGKKRDGLSVKEQIQRLISPPLWPCTLEEYKADYEIHDTDFPFTIGNITVDAMESDHPGGSLIYRLSDGKKKIIYATDFEYGEEKGRELIGFAKDADLMLIDSQYTDDEISTRKGFGHSTVRSGQVIINEANIKITRFVHHDPRHKDEMLKEMENGVKSDTVAFAREGEVIVL